MISVVIYCLLKVLKFRKQRIITGTGKKTNYWDLGQEEKIRKHVLRYRLLHTFLESIGRLAVSAHRLFSFVELMSISTRGLSLKEEIEFFCFFFCCHIYGVFLGWTYERYAFPLCWKPGGRNWDWAIRSMSSK